MLSPEQINDMKNATNKQIKTFSFNGIKTICKVSSVYDSDSCNVIFYFNNVLIRLSIRLAEIDGPEIKPKKLSI